MESENVSPLSSPGFKVWENQIPTHPLDILCEAEIKVTCELIREFFKNEPSLRFCRVFLKANSL